MQNILFRTICRVGIFMICAQAIIHFRPRESYEKYLKLLVSVMILIQLFLPVGRFLMGGGIEQTLEGLELFRVQLEQEMKSAAQEAEAADELLEQMTLEEVRRRMEEQNRQAEEASKEPSKAEEIPEVTVIVGPIEIQ